MGKNKISSARSRLFSPWKLADTNSKSHHNHHFELYAKNGDFEVLEFYFMQIKSVLRKNEIYILVVYYG